MPSTSTLPVSMPPVAWAATFAPDNILARVPLPSENAIAEPSDAARLLAERGRAYGRDEPRPRLPRRDTGWRRPSRRRVLAIRDRLRQMYGRPVNEPHGHPIAELVRTILSQNTNDRNRDVAYGRMRERFPTWEEVRDAPVERARGGAAPGRPQPDQGAADPARARAARRAPRP